MSQIPLTKGRVALVDDDDHFWLSQWKWHYTVSGYAAAEIRLYGRPRYVYMHRLILRAKHGEYVDHANGDKLDNRRDNLRFVTLAQNQHNRRPNIQAVSGYKGVCWHRRQQKWQARIQADGRRVCLGYYDDPAEAAQAYDAAARLLHGEYARLNFPEESE